MTLLRTLKGLPDWVSSHTDEIKQARAAFDQKSANPAPGAGTASRSGRV